MTSFRGGEKIILQLKANKKLKRGWKMILRLLLATESTIKGITYMGKRPKMVKINAI